jgi:hypothetical protein
MPFGLHPQDEFTQRRLQRLELRYRRAQFVLAGAQTVYESMRTRPHADPLRLDQARQRIERAQESLLDIQSIIEYLEDGEQVAPAAAWPTTPEPAGATPPDAAPHAPAGASNRASPAWNWRR